MKKINFYIGANNTTHKVEEEKALDILASVYEGMSVTDTMGYWRGAQEKSILVSIMAESVDLTIVKSVCKRLNTALDQDAVMVEILDSNTLFISDRE